MTNFEYKKNLLCLDNESGVFFTSDTHFCHSNIIRFCNRPFKSVQEMDEVLIKNWNDKVKPDDIVFHLGDFCFGGSDSWSRIVQQLNGHIHLILGNHDRKQNNKQLDAQFDGVYEQLVINIEGRYIHLNHYPLLCYGGTYRNHQDQVWNLFGHVHTCLSNNTGQDFDRLKVLFPGQYDVGVDFNNYTPISYLELKEKINYQMRNNVNMLHWVNEN